MIDFSAGYTGNVGVLTMIGEITLQHADELKMALMRSLGAVDHVVINLEEITDIDLSCFQLLCAAHRTSLKLNKQMTITGNLPEIFKTTINEAGFSRHMGCVLNRDKSCLWIGEGN